MAELPTRREASLIATRIQKEEASNQAREVLDNLIVKICNAINLGKFQYEIRVPNLAQANLVEKGLTEFVNKGYTISTNPDLNSSDYLITISWV